MTDYFDKKGKVFIKLYKTIDDEIFYWETWNADAKNATIHWGKLGELGKKLDKKANSKDELKGIINPLIEEKINEGFAEIPDDEHFTLALTFKLNSWGDTRDLDRREELRNILTTHLGWTGNGRCDDGDIGSGDMTLYAEVVNSEIAIKTVSKKFKDKQVSEEYYFTIMKGDDVITEHIKPE